MKRPLGSICLLFILFIRFFYVCFPPILPDYHSLNGREVYINGQIISIKIQELYGTPTTIYELSGVLLQESSAVSHDSYNSDKNNFVLNTQDKIIHSSEKNTLYQHDKIYCYMEQADEKLRIGSQVWLKGRLEIYESATNFGQFDSRFYYHIQGVGAKLQKAKVIWSDYDCNIWKESLSKCKQYFQQKLSNSFSEKYGGVVQTILLGDKSNLDQTLKKLFQDGGILHILAISGMHISMLGMGSFRLLRKCHMSKKTAAVIGGVIVVIYGALIGTQASSFRAICMFLMQMSALLMGRTYDRLTGLALAAVLLLLEEPMYVFYSGFLLSFGAVLGITIVTPVIEQCFDKKNSILFWGVKLCSGGLGIFLATFPIQLYFYYEYSLYSMFVNVLVLPFLPYIVGFALIVLAVPQAMSFLSVPFVWTCELLLKGYEWICIQNQKLPFHCLVTGVPKSWQIESYYICLIICIFCFQKYVVKQKQKKPVIKRVIPTVCLFFVSFCFLFWKPINGLTCYFLDIGQGDCAVVQYDNKTYVIDCGSTSMSKVGSNILLPCLKYLGISEVEGVFLSHADKDHMNGIIQWLEEYEHSHVRMKHIILPDLEKQALVKEFGEILKLSELAGVSVTKLGAGDSLSLGDLTIEVFHPIQNCSETEDANGYSQVLLLEYLGQGILMTGDIAQEQERQICHLLKNKNIVVLKVPHHGSKYSSSKEFLIACQPEYSLFSYGEGNRYGHPHQEVIERIKAVGSEILTTAQQGQIRIEIRTKQGVPNVEVSSYKETVLYEFCP